MALNSGKILMRRGQEVNFDPSKMIPGEWAVSLDSKYVRMCFQPGVCVRMATYDAFEADMVQIRRILAECQTVEEAVQRIYEEIKNVAVDVERIETAAANALKSEQNALNSANSASQSANTATQKANEASESANTTSAKAEQATEGARIATEKASEAENSAENVRNMSDVSQSYAVGGTGTREGEDTDNSKYYNQQASDNADRAEAAAERASAVADVGVATSEKAGLVKPDGDTIRVDPDGTIHADRGTTSYADLENKPKINDVELDGEKTLEELGIASKEALEKTDSKVNIIIEQAELRFKETASGENIHLDDSADSKLVEFTMYGKAMQDGEPTPENPVDIEVSGESYNLIPYPYKDTKKELNGITFTDNGDGSVTVNGTATEDVGLNLIDPWNIDYAMLLEPNTSYILTGCPSGGSKNSYSIQYRLGDYTYENATWGNDFGNPHTFTTTSDKVYFGCRILIISGSTIDNLVFKPMLRKASVKNDRYMLYGKGNVEVKSIGKNLLPYPYDETTHIESGVTWTDNNGIITTAGTATDMNDFLFISASTPKLLKKGTYILSGCPSGGELDKTYFLLLGKVVNGQNSRIVSDTGSGATFTLNEDTTIYLVGRFIAGTNAEGLTFKPMIRLASDTDDTYEPYKSKAATITTENGIAGIKVDNGGNYTDSNGQQWICDEIVKYADGSGEYVKRISKRIIDGVNNKCNYVNPSLAGKTETLVQINFGANAEWTDSYLPQLKVLLNRGIFFVYSGASSCFRYGLRRDPLTGVCCYYIGTDEGVTDIATANTWLQNNPVTLYYAINPIRTPLTAEQLAEIEKLSTFYSVTNISNDADCGMKVKYIVDSKNYIDNKLALQAKAREEEIMSMLLLLPEETQAKMIEKDTNNLLNESEA